jgi:hypothetical protein
MLLFTCIVRDPVIMYLFVNTYLKHCTRTYSKVFMLSLAWLWALSWLSYCMWLTLVGVNCSVWCGVLGGAKNTNKSQWHFVCMCVVRYSMCWNYMLSICCGCVGVNVWKVVVSGEYERNITYIMLTHCRAGWLLGCTWSGWKHRNFVGRQFGMLAGLRWGWGEMTFVRTVAC